jgi:dihydroxyacetone kinase
MLGVAETFKRDRLDGFVTAYGREIRKVPGAYGGVGRQVPRQGKVAVVIGGGCGHYPAFAGLVGPGLADGAVVDDVFTSPSAEQVHRTARAANGGPESCSATATTRATSSTSDSPGVDLPPRASKAGPSW